MLLDYQSPGNDDKVVSHFSGDHLDTHFGKRCIFSCLESYSGKYLKEIIVIQVLYLVIWR